MTPTSPEGPPVTGLRERAAPRRPARRRAGILVALCVAALAHAAACSPGAPGEAAPDRVRAVVLPFLTMTPFHIADEEGLFSARHLQVDFVRLPRIQELMAAVSRGEVDAAAGMLNISVLNSIAAGNRVRLVGALGYLTPGECSFHGWVTRRDTLESGRLDDPGTLRDMLFDANMLLPEAYWLDTSLRAAGLTIDDLELIDIPPAPTAEAVVAGSVDVASLPEPLLGMALAREELALWRRSEDMAPGHVVSVMMYGPTLLDERPDVGMRFAAAVRDGIRRFRRGKTPDNRAAVQRFTEMTPEQVSRACWPGTRADGRLEYASFRAYQEWAVARGLLDRVLSEDEVIDRRFLGAGTDAAR